MVVAGSTAHCIVTDTESHWDIESKMRPLERMRPLGSTQELKRETGLHSNLEDPHYRTATRRRRSSLRRERTNRRCGTRKMCDRKGHKEKGVVTSAMCWGGHGSRGPNRTAVSDRNHQDCSKGATAEAHGWVEPRVRSEEAETAEYYYEYGLLFFQNFLFGEERQFWSASIGCFHMK